MMIPSYRRIFVKRKKYVVYKKESRWFSLKDAEECDIICLTVQKYDKNNLIGQTGILMPLKVVRCIWKERKLWADIDWPQQTTVTAWFATRWKKSGGARRLSRRAPVLWPLSWYCCSSQDIRPAANVFRAETVFLSWKSFSIRSWHVRRMKRHIRPW